MSREHDLEQKYNNLLETIKNKFNRLLFTNSYDNYKYIVEKTKLIDNIVICIRNNLKDSSKFKELENIICEKHPAIYIKELIQMPSNLIYISNIMFIIIIIITISTILITSLILFLKFSK